MLRFSPVILAALAVWGLACPQCLLADNAGGGRWVFFVILALAFLAFWHNFRRSGQ